MSAKFEKIETIRITLDNDIYCDVTPSAEALGFHDFIFNRKGYGNPAFLFSVQIESPEHAVKLAEAGADEYWEYLVEIDESDDE